MQFSKDKTPYNSHFSFGFRRGTALRRGGYYFKFKPGNSFLACGFFSPNSEDLKRIREEFAFDDLPMRKILKSKLFVSTFKNLQGDKIKTTPKGFDSKSSAIDLLRYKQFLVIRRFTDKEVLSDSFFKEACLTLKNMRPFFDYMSEILSTDLNGIEK